MLFITWNNDFSWYRVPELPSVDMFVTTADAVLEPPIITVNTVLSLLAVDYPTHKLACYVSDDGCSPVTYYSLVEASKFAKLWVPFCKKYNIHVRAPFRYFSNNPLTFGGSSMEFQQEWNRMKVIQKPELAVIINFSFLVTKVGIYKIGLPENFITPLK